MPLGPRSGATLLGAVALILLTGCVTTPTFPTSPPSSPAGTPTSPSPSPAATAPPSPSPAPVAAPDRVVIDAEFIRVLADDGSELARFDYFQPTAEVIAGLDSYLGASEQTWFEGRGHAMPATYHDWGGLRLADTVPAGQRPYDPEHWVSVTSVDANGVTIMAPDDVVVGDAVGPLIEADGTDEVHRWTSPETAVASVSFRIDLVELPPMPGADPSDDWSPSFGVMVVGDETAGVVTRLAAPSANFGA
jgi:hypothetical protein